MTSQKNNVLQKEIQGRKNKSPSSKASAAPSTLAGILLVGDSNARRVQQCLPNSADIDCFDLDTTLEPEIKSQVVIMAGTNNIKQQQSAATCMSTRFRHL